MIHSILEYNRSELSPISLFFKPSLQSPINHFSLQNSLVPSSFFFIFFISLLTSPSLFAGILDINILYFSDSTKLTATTTNSKISYDLGLGFTFNKNSGLLFELVFSSFSATENDGTTNTSFVVTDQGIKVGYIMGKSRQWGTSLTYGLISKADYNDGTNTVELRGSSIKFDFGYNFWMGESSALALKLYYYAPTFTEEINSTTINKVSYSRTVLYPGINLFWVF